MAVPQTLTIKAYIIFALIILAMNLLLPKSDMMWGRESPDDRTAVIWYVWGENYPVYEYDLQKRCQEERARPTR